MPGRRPNLGPEDRQDLMAAIRRCKGPIRHRWELIVADVEERPKWGVLALFQCDCCTTKRRYIFSSITGELLSRDYDYPPEWYLVDRVPADEARLAWARDPGVGDRLLVGSSTAKLPGRKKR